MFQATRMQRQAQISPDSDEQPSSRQTHRSRSIVTVGGLTLASSCLLAVLLSGSFRQAPPAHATPNASATPPLHLAHSRRFRIVPEYERHMERVVLSMSSSDTVPKYHDEILSSLPDYTRIDVMVPDSNLSAVKTWIDDKSYRDRVRLVAYDPQYRSGARLYLLLPDEEQLVAVDTDGYRLGSQQGTLWAQDLFEVATADDNRTILLTACAHKCFQSERHRRDSRVISDNAYLACLDGDDTEVRRLPLAFKGGNVLIDELNGKRIVFCGYDSVRSTRTAWRAFEGKEISDRRVAEMVENAFAADEVVIVGGTRPQPQVMYHLDQTMMPLGSGTIAVARVIGECPCLEPNASRIRLAKAFLANLRFVLIDLGYKIVDLDATVDNVLRYQHYVNLIPYVDKDRNQRMVLMPVFAEDMSKADQKIVRKNTKTLESLGYKVVCVPTRAGELTGGIHCLVNVLR